MKNIRYEYFTYLYSFLYLRLQVFDFMVNISRIKPPICLDSSSVISLGLGNVVFPATAS